MLLLTQLLLVSVTFVNGFIWNTCTDTFEDFDYWYNSSQLLYAETSENLPFCPFNGTNCPLNTRQKLEEGRLDGDGIFYFHANQSGNYFLYYIGGGNTAKDDYYSFFLYARYYGHQLVQGDYMYVKWIESQYEANITLPLTQNLEWNEVLINMTKISYIPGIEIGMMVASEHEAYFLVEKLMVVHIYDEIIPEWDMEQWKYLCRWNETLSTEIPTTTQDDFDTSTEETDTSTEETDTSTTEEDPPGDTSTASSVEDDPSLGTVTIVLLAIIPPLAILIGCCCYLNYRSRERKRAALRYAIPIPRL